MTRPSSSEKGPRLIDASRRALEGVLAVAQSGATTADGSLAPEVTGWFASPEEGIEAAIEAAAGIEETLAALSRLAPSALTVVGALSTARASWAEVTRQAAGQQETCLVGCSAKPDGSVGRVVFVRAPLVPTPLVPALEADAVASVPEARPTLELYFDDLQNARFREAAEHFTANTIYSHPPYGGAAERVLYLGRDALRNGFATDRGESPVRQVITGLWQSESRVFVEGVIEGIANGGTFLSTAQFNPAGKIARYVAFYSATRLVSAELHGRMARVEAASHPRSGSV